ncbi:MAG TPA: DUF3592 domain-containing protein [Xanthobacteraceae bacterium]|jgi:hypothetical protein
MLSSQALLWTTVAAAVCGLMAVGLLYSVVRASRRLSASRNWPVVPGEVVASEVDVPPVHDSDDTADCSPRIRYRYRVGDQDFESDCVKPGGTAMAQRQFAEELVARYPVGARVDVTIDPRAPKDAVLEPANTDNMVAQIAFLIVFAAVAAVLAAHAAAGKVLATEGGVPLFAFLLPVAALLIGAFCVAGFLQMRRRARASTTWPTATGKITTSRVATDVYRIEDKDDQTRRVRFENKYRPVVNYVYGVGGRDYFGSGVNGSWVSLHGSPDVPQAVVAAYPAGKEVAVYYDPLRPRTAVLERGNAPGSKLALVAATIFSLGGVLMLWVFTSI